MLLPASRRLVWAAYRDTETGLWGHFTCRDLPSVGLMVIMQNDAKTAWGTGPLMGASFKAATPEDVMIAIDAHLGLDKPIPGGAP